MGVIMLPSLYQLVVHGISTVTLYPDANPEVSSVDGYVARGSGAGMTWLDVHDGIGTFKDDSNPGTTGLTIGWSRAATFLPPYSGIDRAITLFDARQPTPPVPIGAIAISAVLSIYGTQHVNNSPVGAPGEPSMNVYTTLPTSNIALATSDYNIAKWGSTQLSTTIITQNFAVGSYNDFILNAAGLAVVQAALDGDGVIKLGFRFGYDVSNTPPGGFASTGYYNRAYASDYGAGYKPKLVLTYQT
jgi:hypothetical protein